MALHSAPNRAGDAAERDIAREKAADGHLVGGVHGRGHRPPLGDRLVGVAQAREAFAVGGGEIQGSRVGEIEGGEFVLEPLAYIAADVVHPVTGKTIRDLLLEAMMQ